MSCNKLIILFVLYSFTSLKSQLYNHFEADFSMMEKNVTLDSSYLNVGHISYDLYLNLATYDLVFPIKRKYIIRDSILTEFDSLDNLIRVKTMSNLNELAVFKNILKNEMGDFGIKESGFTIHDVQKVEASVLTFWQAPHYIKLVKEIITKKTDNILTGVIYKDGEKNTLNRMFFENYINLKGLQIPQAIKSYFIINEKEVYKQMTLSNVNIQ